ncbi:hypothetical protein XFPR_12230 [Xylella fastidiosa]|uniref:Uncharacterized protein n=2 Tax=Xylella fastidiosa TaxID=2371 RepID=A0ABD7BYD1_XYLFS|nr:hypothetical protein [Xylella fastidiosa]AAF82833.1 hypothetical protein XF_0020 [Xylella fastidiosa 9a5c]MDG5823214.1 hypothetical protein [Xylella fastidiosa subsp. pauca]MDG5826489.1 hypothetical protein [Xylella fastidiosa subsp. pauca]QPB72627.1 hypothetical protein XFHB_13230 [Xylella fastidiosa]QPB72955.1 hypothetical protein XFPR_12230 [Xylella fastidiosa]
MAILVLGNLFHHCVLHRQRGQIAHTALLHDFERGVIAVALTQQLNQQKATQQ